MVKLVDAKTGKKLSGSANPKKSSSAVVTDHDAGQNKVRLLDVNTGKAVVPQKNKSNPSAKKAVSPAFQTRYSVLEEGTPKRGGNKNIRQAGAAFGESLLSDAAMLGGSAIHQIQKQNQAIISPALNRYDRKAEKEDVKSSAADLRGQRCPRTGRFRSARKSACPGCSQRSAKSRIPSDY
jgi:hypothetical protein